MFVDYHTELFHNGTNRSLGGAFLDLYEIRIALNAGKSIYDLPLRVTYYARVSTDKGRADPFPLSSGAVLL